MSASSKSSESNGIEENGDCEIPQEKTISEDMPKWKQEQRKRYNEKIRKEAEERNARKKREEEELQQKWEGVPAWKATIIRKREEIKKLEEERVFEAQRKEEEEKARWENLPVWKRGIYQKKGLKPVNKTPEHINPSTTDSQVTRDESTPDNCHASEDAADQDNCAPTVDEQHIEEFNANDATKTTDADGDQQEQHDDEQRNGDICASDNDEVFVQEDKEIPIIVQDAPQENEEVSKNEQIDDNTAVQQINETVEQEDQPNGLTAV